MSDMGLPVLRRVPGWLTVDGAGPDLLQELLDRYEAEIRQRCVPLWESMRPGLSRGEIVDRLGAAGLPAPEELVVWWMWHDGHELPHHGGLLGREQISLASAV